MIITILVIKACKAPEVTPNEKAEELKTTHTKISTERSVDSAKYIAEIQYLEAELEELKAAAGKTTVEYVTVYEAYLDQPMDSITITEVVEVCNDLVKEQAEVIETQDETIATHVDYIAKQDGTIVELDELIVESHATLDEANEKNVKSEKKLKRTRKIGIASFIVGVLGGIGIVIAL